LFREFYAESEFKKHYEHCRALALTPREVGMETSPALEGPNGIHPKYRRKSSEAVIHKRYRLLAGQLKYTLPQLLKSLTFLNTIRELRQGGWKDWHILQATASIRLNYVIGMMELRSPSIEEYKKVGKAVYEREEKDSDPIPPAEMFSAADMRRALEITQVSTLRGLGFHCWQRTPNFEGVDRFLRRFNYWADDVEHSKVLPD
jgi:hypothetical protein